MDRIPRDWFFFVVGCKNHIQNYANMTFEKLPLI
jgi:hypothetical protein